MQKGNWDSDWKSTGTKQMMISTVCVEQQQKKKRSESSFERNALVRNSSVERERSKKEKQRGNEFEKVRETNVNKPAQEERI